VRTDLAIQRAGALPLQQQWSDAVGGTHVNPMHLARKLQHSLNSAVCGLGGGHEEPLRAYEVAAPAGRSVRVGGEGGGLVISRQVDTD